ncbi:hypothetical protein IE81DRAFT_167166 [Ceraceosorus guamensis]|uniref:Uncharacterized protein n=1 Tax=Ceraceosorus guamensis TaxID=1522189 RepID=A0A316W733_9BASI|nr:hypothetical protein IE81DRAFT_167166 [Ceraceosorus guamensis]PWN45730.1 hypothetical protein IE81DRAFT_167166 [Ceraceosorus guamensis]
MHSHTRDSRLTTLLQPRFFLSPGARDGACCIYAGSTSIRRTPRHAACAVQAALEALAACCSCCPRSTAHITLQAMLDVRHALSFAAPSHPVTSSAPAIQTGLCGLWQTKMYIHAPAHALLTRLSSDASQMTIDSLPIGPLAPMALTTGVIDGLQLHQLAPCCISAPLEQRTTDGRISTRICRKV